MALEDARSMGKPNEQMRAQPFLLRFARERPTPYVAFHFDERQQLNVIDGTDIPVAGMMRHLLKTQGVIEDS
jgi:hypothetical protein